MPPVSRNDFGNGSCGWFSEAFRQASSLCARSWARATRMEAHPHRSARTGVGAPLQLDRVPLRPLDSQILSSEDTPPGVEHTGAVTWTLPSPPRRVAWWGGLAIAAMVLFLLGQGEPRTADPRFRSPSVTLDTYWQALRHDDDFTAQECLIEPSKDLPSPGMLWFLPPTTSLRIANLHSLPVETDRVMASYEVRFVPLGGGGEQTFRQSAELVRIRGEWRIGHPIGEVSMPEWRSIPRAVDL